MEVSGRFGATYFVNIRDRRRRRKQASSPHVKTLDYREECQGRVENVTGNRTSHLHIEKRGGPNFSASVLHYGYGRDGHRYRDFSHALQTHVRIVLPGRPR
jgi:hypothetical protein